MKSISAVLVGFSPTARIVSLEPGTIDAATRKNADDDRSPGISSSRPFSRCPPSMLMTPFLLSAPRQTLEAPAPLIASDHVLTNNGSAGRKQARKQYAALHLSACNRKSVVDRLQRSAMNRDWWKLTVSASIVAPISRNGFMIRSIGRRDSDSSPRSSR